MYVHGPQGRIQGAAAPPTSVFLIIFATAREAVQAGSHQVSASLICQRT